MPSRSYYEALWQALPAGLEPQDFELRKRFLLERVAPGARVLDLGCGEGVFASELLHAGAEVVGVDVAEEPLRRGRLSDPSLDLRLIEPAGPWDDLKDASFDVVWAGEVIEHVADTGAWMSELRRVLRSGGSLLLSTPAHSRAMRLGLALSERSFARHFDPLGDHLRFYSVRTLSVLLAEFGFQDVSASRAAGGAARRRLSASPRLLLASAVRSRF